MRRLNFPPPDINVLQTAEGNSASKLLNRPINVGGMLILFSFILLTLVSCRFYDVNWDDVDPPDDLDFILQGTAEPIVYTRNTTIYDNYAFTSDGNGVIAIYNVINSFNPYLESHIQLPTNQIIQKIEVDWRLNLYVAAGNDGVFIVDTSSPSFPSVVNEYPHLYALDLSLQEDYLAVVDQAGWSLFFIQSSAQLSEVNSYRFPDNRQPVKILLRNNWVYVFSRFYVDIFDITNIYNIRLERSFSFANRIVDFDIIGNFIALVTTSELYFIDITFPLSASIEGDYALFLTPRTLRARNDKLFIGYENRSLSVYQVWGVHILPTEVSRISFQNVVLDVDFRSDLIYMSAGNTGLLIYYFLL